MTSLVAVTTAEDLMHPQRLWVRARSLGVPGADDDRPLGRGRRLRSQLVRYPDENFSVAVLCNTNEVDTDERIELYTPTAEQLQQYVGRYESDEIEALYQGDDARYMFVRRDP